MIMTSLTVLLNLKNSYPSFMSVGSQMPELHRGAFCPPPLYKIGSQNIPYKLRLTFGGGGGGSECNFCLYFENSRK